MTRTELRKLGFHKTRSKNDLGFMCLTEYSKSFKIKYFGEFTLSAQCFTKLWRPKYFELSINCDGLTHVLSTYNFNKSNFMTCLNKLNKMKESK